MARPPKPRATPRKKNPTRVFSSPTPADDTLIVTTTHPVSPKQPFQPLPAPTGAAPYHLALADVLTHDQMQAIQDAGRLAFHIVGDTGGVKRPEAQQIVTDHMVSDFSAADGAAPPAFFYHLGDVVYFYGETDKYFDQFYEPYQLYNAPIFAIPGNHDGDLLPGGGGVASLAAFARNFCARTIDFTPEAEDVQRHAMTQPNVYWTLVAPFVTIIGLYTNVPEGGKLDNHQIAWFTNELQTAPPDKALLVAMHHPTYSLDPYHAGSQYMLDVLDTAVGKAGRVPDAIFAGHVHNYQRYTRAFNGRQMPFIVAGAGGYWHLHALVKQNGQELATPLAIPGSDVTLESHIADRHGYLLLEITPDTLTGRYYTVPRPQESWRAPAQLFDQFTLDLKAHKLS